MILSFLLSMLAIFYVDRKASALDFLIWKKKYIEMNKCVVNNLRISENGSLSYVRRPKHRKTVELLT